MRACVKPISPFAFGITILIVLSLVSLSLALYYHFFVGYNLFALFTCVCMNAVSC